MEFDGRSVLVTGGSIGIGLAAARLLASRGARVVCASVTPPAAALLDTADDAIHFLETDVTDETREGLNPEPDDPSGSVLAVRGLDARGLPARRFGG